RTNHKSAEKLRRQEEEMRAYFDKTFEPQIIGGGASLANGGKPLEPPKAFAENCAVCHGDNAEGNPIAPTLIGVAGKPQRSKEDLLKIIDNPKAYGLNEMPDTLSKIPPEDKQKIVEWLMTLKAQ